MACDLCGKVTPDTIELSPHLQTPKMAAVCYDCSKKLNRRLGQLRSRAISAAWRKLRIEMAGGKIVRPWWRGLFG